MKRVSLLFMIVCSMAVFSACGFEGSASQKEAPTIGQKAQSVNGAAWMRCIRKCEYGDADCYKECNKKYSVRVQKK